MDININAIASALNNKMDRDISNKTGNFHYVKTSFADGTEGYRIWDDGFCIMWGSFPKSTAWTQTVTKLYKTFANTNYIVLTSTGHTANTDANTISAKTTTTFTSARYNSTETAGWVVIGFLASGQY